MLTLRGHGEDPGRIWTVVRVGGLAHDVMDGVLLIGLVQPRLFKRSTRS